MVNIGSGDGFFPVRYKAVTWTRCIESRLVPLDTLGTGLYVIIIYGTRTSDDYSEQFTLESIYNIFNE